MITQFEDLPGVIKVHYGCWNSVVLIYKDDFACIVVEEDYHDEKGIPVMADYTNEDALNDAKVAEARGAAKLLASLREQENATRVAQEKARLKYLMKQYPEMVE